MPMPCGDLISLDVTPHWQVVSRCVGREHFLELMSRPGEISAIGGGYAAMFSRFISGLGFGGPGAPGVIEAP